MEQAVETRSDQLFKLISGEVKRAEQFDDTLSDPGINVHPMTKKVALSGEKMAQENRTSTISANIKRNRLDITLRGAISKKEAERIYTDIRFCISDLKPGFAVITDLTGAHLGHLSAIGTFQKITKFLVEKQVGPVIRIVGKANIIFRQIARLSSETSYQPQYTKTREEAELLLANLTEKRSAA